MDVVEVGGGDTGLTGPGVVGTDDGAHLVIEQSVEPDSVDVSVQLRDEGDVEAVVEEGTKRVVVLQRLDAQLGLGQLLVHRAHDVGHPLVIGRALRRQPEWAPTAVGEFTQVEAGGPQFAERDAGGVQHPPPGGGGDEAAAAFARTAAWRAGPRGG